MEHRLNEQLKWIDECYENWDQEEDMQDEEKIWKEVLPCGVLRAQGTKYFLLDPAPVDTESYSRHMYLPVFLVMPFEKIGMNKDGSRNVYASPRHLIVSGDFTIEYAGFDFTLLALDGGDNERSY